MVHRKTMFSGSDRGVSPVVGVILMVAVTVILAAVLAQYVLGLSSLLKQPPQAGVTISESQDQFTGNYNVSVMASSMPNAETIRVQCSTCSPSERSSISENPSGPITEVGITKTLSNVPAGEDIAIIGTTGSGNSQVLQTHTVGD